MLTFVEDKTRYYITTLFINNLNNNIMENLTKNVFIFEYMDKDNNCLYSIVEAYITKYGFSHSECVVCNGFISKVDASLYCNELNFKIVNL